MAPARSNLIREILFNPETEAQTLLQVDNVINNVHGFAEFDVIGVTEKEIVFHDGKTLYKQNYGAMQLGVKTPAHVIDGRCWNNHYYYIAELELQMRRFLNNGEFASFKFHAELLRESLESVKEAVGG